MVSMFAVFGIFYGKSEILHLLLDATLLRDTGTRQDSSPWPLDHFPCVKTTAVNIGEPIAFLAIHVQSRSFCWVQKILLFKIFISHSASLQIIFNILQNFWKKAAAASSSLLLSSSLSSLWLVSLSPSTSLSNLQNFNKTSPILLQQNWKWMVVKSNFVDKSNDNDNDIDNFLSKRFVNA